MAEAAESPALADMAIVYLGSSDAGQKYYVPLAFQSLILEGFLTGE